MRQALTTGFRHVSSDIVIIMMSDLSDNPKQVDQMVKKISEGYDFVCATRYSSGGKRIGGSMLKAFMSWFACITLRMITGIPTSDATNAYKCFKRDLLEKVTIESKAGFEIPLELIVKAYRIGYQITEVPTVWRERETGSSSFKIFSWIPYYMRWYTAAITYRYFRQYEK
jgi:glycosyltransferase involved in cell wall biosynthesis